MIMIFLKISQLEPAEIWLRNQKKQKRHPEEERFYLHFLFSSNPLAPSIQELPGLLIEVFPKCSFVSLTFLCA